MERTRHMPASPTGQRWPPWCHAKLTGPLGNQDLSSPQVHTVVMPAKPRPPRMTPQAQPLPRAG